MEKADEFVKRIRQIDHIIARRMVEYERWNSIASDIGCPSLGERVSSSRNLNRGADAICSYVGIDSEIASLGEERERIVKILDRLPTDEHDVIFELYVDSLSIKEVAYQHHRSYEWVKIKRKKALELIQSMLDSETA